MLGMKHGIMEYILCYVFESLLIDKSLDEYDKNKLLIER